MGKDERGEYCKAYLFPEAKWRNGRCPLAPPIEKETKKGKDLDPIKKSKRGLK